MAQNSEVTQRHPLQQHYQYRYNAHVLSLFSLLSQKSDMMTVGVSGWQVDKVQSLCCGTCVWGVCVCKFKTSSLVDSYNSLFMTLEVPTAVLGFTQGLGGWGGGVYSEM